MQEEGRLSARVNYVKPLLTDKNKEVRVEYAKSFLRPSSNGHHVFDDMHDYVHVDEKWFYLTKVKRRFYVYDDEDVALRSVKPRYDPHTKMYFDGKLGVWPFVEATVAKRTSKNRPKGAVVTSPQTVTAEVYQDVIVNKVIPAIKEKMPSSRRRNQIWIQQDNAGPHRQLTTDVLRLLDINGIGVACQPPNSPDFNVLDLGFFNSIQSLQYQKRSRSIDELIGSVECALSELPIGTLAKTFITLQKVMQMTIAMHGSNDFKPPHMHKDSTIGNLFNFNVRFVLNK
ncbi:Aste57867_16157 [Aphanomyces stellatus]|uniref:Aste57867_16157 protein n=1 Tax=Aphanomyces stellatus TaxID=120398 RepID=A0A485L4S7_9STRA|nr:hypothetical protein As57867_016101 [Aphanomyces stellatus]VFT92936.1 Aste57867_16157 [Aphanomyces stellatus]